VQVRFDGKRFEVVDVTRLKELREKLEDQTGVPSASQKLIHKGRRLEDDDLDLFTAGIGVVQMIGLRKDQIQDAKEASSVINDLDVDYDVLAQKKAQKSAELERETYRKRAGECEYRFEMIRVLEQFRDKDEAFRLLEDLATDPGIVAVLKKHKWKVGTLSEMYPDGKVGVDPVCVLGLNVNKGQEIQLRLRTDNLKGFRKRAVIRETLAHELAHVEISDHNADFYALMSQIQSEMVELDWRQTRGNVLGGEFRVNYGLMARQAVAKTASALGGTFVLGGVENLGPISRDLMAEAALKRFAADPQENAVHSSPSTSPAPDEMKTRDTSPPPKVAKDEISFQDIEDPPEEVQKRLRSAISSVLERNEPETALNAFVVLMKVSRNVLKDPGNENLRRLRISTNAFKTKLGPVLGARNILHELNWKFNEEGSFLVLEKDDLSEESFAFALRVLEESVALSHMLLTS